MIKLLSANDTKWNDISATLMKVSRAGVDHDWAEKRASVLSREMADLRPEPGYEMVHLLAVGDTERYGANRNGDGFRAEENAKNAHYFKDNGHLYKHHQNKDPAKASGKVALAAHNPEMGRVELVVAMAQDKCAEEIQKLAKGEELDFSMGTHVAYDVCSICGHRAPTPRQYCEHAKTAMTQILDDGRQVYVDNPDPHYFDISIVGRGADRIAKAFGKVASAGSGEFMFSADMAKLAGLWVPAHILALDPVGSVHRKMALLQRLASMEKEIEGKLTPVDERILASMEKKQVLTEEDAKKLQKVGFDAALGALHRAKILLPVKDFVRLAADRSYHEVEALTDEVESALPGVFGRMAKEGQDCCENAAFDGDASPELPQGAKAVVEKLSGHHGMGDIPLGHRIAVTIIRARPPVLAKKTASSDPAVEGLARLYASYKLAALSYHQNLSDSALTKLAVLQNYA